MDAGLNVINSYNAQKHNQRRIRCGLQQRGSSGLELQTYQGPQQRLSRGPTQRHLQTPQPILHRKYAPPHSDIRTGEFTQISENYMIESVKDNHEEQTFTTNSFDTEMELLFASLQEQLNKITTFFQGLFAGMALLYCITLNLSLSVSSDLVRV